MPQLQQFATEENHPPYQSESLENSTDVRTAAPETAMVAEEKRATRTLPVESVLATPLTGEVPARHRHVRFDELASAISKIEARKDEAVVQTQPLGIALAQANINVAIEHVWEEIQKQRERSVQVRPTRNILRRKPRRFWLNLTVGMVCLLVTLAALYVLMGDFSRVR